MKKIVLGIGASVLLFGGAVAVVQAQSGEDSAVQSESTLTYTTIEQDVANGALLLDVRTPEEYAAGHFAGAELLPVQNIEQGILPPVEKDTTIYVYCRSGNRSAAATKALQDAGYTSIVDLGGLSDVQKIGGTL